MKIGVTGAAGHIGNMVCRILIDQGHQVRAFYHKEHDALIGLDLELMQGDVLNKEDVNKFVDGCDVVIHSAAIISIHGDPTGIVFRTNTEGPQNIIDACINAGVKRLLHLSSTHAVQELPLDQPFDETRPYKRKDQFPYDYSKACGEQIALEAFRSGKLDGCVLRPSSVVGINDYKPSELGKALLDFYNRKIPVLPQGGYNFIDVRDVSQTIVNAIEKGRTGEIYLMSGKYYSLKELAAEVTKASGVKTPKLLLPFWFLKMILPFVKLWGKITKAAPVFTIEAITALKLGHPNMVNKKAVDELGHKVRPLSETLKDFYDWQIQRGVLKKK
ncbi:MAG: NAD-dependent epimerase/dehydratase family protein [Crocinitomicaceae bacterium]